MLPLSLLLGLTSLAFLLMRGRLTGARGGAAWTAGALAAVSPLLLFGASSGPVSLDPRLYLPRIATMPGALLRTLSLLYSLHPDAGQEAARHLLFLEPPLSILAGLGIADALALPGRLARVASLALALTLCDRGAQYVRVLGDDGVYGPLGRSDPRDTDALIEFLRERGVAHVMSEDGT